MNRCGQTELNRRCKPELCFSIFVNDKTCIKPLSKIFIVFLNKYYKYGLTYLEPISIDSQSANYI